QQSDGATENLGEPLVRDSRVVARPLHRAAEDGVAAAREDVAVLVIENRGRAVVGPRGGGHLAPQRLDGQGTRQPADLRSPYARRELRVLHGGGSAGGDDPGYATLR